MSGRLALLGTLCALGLIAVSVYFIRETRDLSAAVEPRENAGLAGIWRSRGYGWVWVIEDGRLRAYHLSGSFCQEASARSARNDLARNHTLSPDGNVLRLHRADPTYEFTFDRIAALPEACVRPADASPPGVMAALAQVFAAHYAFFAERQVDWPQAAAAAERRISADSSADELLKAAANLLDHIDDDHVTLMADIDGRRFECVSGGASALSRITGRGCRPASEPDDAIARWQQSVWSAEMDDQELKEQTRTTANDSIRYGRIGDDIGLLSILSMEGFATGDDDDTDALNDALDAAMETFRDARAVIVDVSLNDGGEDRLARQIAARFASKRTLAYSKYAGDAPGAKPQAVYIEPPADRPRYAGPVYLLTSNVTVSAAEVFALAMRALPNVTHVGETTRGSLSDELHKELPNGWRVTLSNEVYLDSSGKAWEGRGIPPEIPLQVFARDGTDPEQTHAAALRAIVGRIPPL